MRSRLKGGVMVLLLLVVFGGTSQAGEFKANVQFGGSVMVLNVPVKEILSSYLVVSGPEGYRLEKDWGSGSVVSVDLTASPNGQAIGLLEGVYKWELRVYTGPLSEATAAGSVLGSPTTAGSAGSASEQWMTTGRFRVERGSIVAVLSEEKGEDQGKWGTFQGVAKQQTGSPVVPLWEVISGHLYATGGVCSGCYSLDPDLANGELLVKSGAPWITMRDTDNDQRWRWYSSIGQLFLTSSPLNGASETFPLSIERNTPDNTLYLDNNGIVGIGTSAPSTHLNISGLDIVRPSRAGIRMKSTNIGAHGWAWSAGTAGCYLTDETGNTTPFYVLNGAPEGTLKILGDGTVDVSGGNIPHSQMHFSLAGTDTGGWITSWLDNNFFLSSGAMYNQSAGGWIQKSSNGKAVIAGSGDAGYRLVTTSGNTVGQPIRTPVRLHIDYSGNVGLGITPAYPLHLAGGAYSDGMYWIDGSSREYKEDIELLSTQEALDVIRNLNPVRFAYKGDRTNRHVGFIAEDVPELVATKDRKGLSPMDIVAVLTKVVQEKSQLIEKLERTLEAVEKRLSSLEKQ